MKQHPLSAAFPAMSDSDFEALVEDIRKNGQREAVIVFDGMVLDGWHRFTACKVAKKKCETAEHDGIDPVAFVLSRNLHRRHLTASQRAQAVVSATAWKQVGKPSNSAPGAELTAAQMAKAADVGQRTVEQAKSAAAVGLGDAVRDGKVSAKAAAEVAKLPPKERARAVEAINKGEGAPPAPKGPTKEEKLHQQVDEMRAALTEAADEIQRLSAIKGEEGDAGELIKTLQAELRAVKAKRDDLMRENAELKRQVRILERKTK